MLNVHWIEDLLDQEGVEFQERHHPEAFTAQRLAQREHVSGHRVAKVVIVMARGKPVELILPASRRVVLDRVKDILGTSDVRLASEDEILAYFTDCEPGALPALRHWENVNILMDESMRVPGDILFPAGSCTDAVRMTFQDWFDLVQPWVGRFAEPRDFGPRFDPGQPSRN